MIPFRFYAITDRLGGQPGGRSGGESGGESGSHTGPRGDPVRLLPDLARAGLRALQVREKDLSPAALADFCGELLQSLGDRRPGVRVFLNDRADLALGLGLDGVHLREDSLPLQRQSPQLRERLSWGVSTHSLAGVQAAEAAGADFVTFGPVYPTPSKQAYGDPVGLQALEDVCRRCGVPVLALGGVTPQRARECREAGAHGAAAISALWNAPDPVETLRAFEEALGGL